MVLSDLKHSTIIIAGRGPSAYLCKDWPRGVPVLGVSGAHDAVPNMAHWCTVDKALCFPEWLCQSLKFQKHVAKNKYWEDWQQCPSARCWEYIQRGDPDFGLFAPSPIVSGPLARNHSLFFAVQLAPRLGYTRCVFVGCDLIENELRIISDTLKAWHPLALKAGMVWENASPISTLQEWMPDDDNTFRPILQEDHHAHAAVEG